MKSTIGPIDIQIEDPKKFALVAILVDRNDFLLDISDVRTQLKLTTIPYVLPKLPKEVDYITNRYNYKKSTINEVRMVLEELCIDKFPPNLAYFDKLLGSAVVMTESLLKKYNRGRSFFSVIFASILVGVITDFDFRSTYMVEFNNIKEVRLELENYEAKDGLVAIVVNRESTTKDVLNVFDHIRKYRFKTKKISTEDGLKNIYEDKAPTDKFIDTLSAIKETRKWYWWNINENISVKKIWNQLGGDNAGISEKGIERNIARYKKLLNKSI